MIERLEKAAEQPAVREVERITVTRIVEKRGLGEGDSPIRTVVSYWLDNGAKIGEDDPVAREIKP